MIMASVLAAPGKPGTPGKLPRCPRPNSEESVELVKGGEGCFSLTHHKHFTLREPGKEILRTLFLAFWETDCALQTGPVREVRPGPWTGVGDVLPQAGGMAPSLNPSGAGRLIIPKLLIRGALTPWPIITQHPARAEGIICREEGNQSRFFSQEN